MCRLWSVFSFLLHKCHSCLSHTKPEPVNCETFENAHTAPVLMWTCPYSNCQRVTEQTLILNFRF